MMRRKEEKEEGVSAVIAVILMVAITVVLAGVLYVWVMGMATTSGGTGATIGLQKSGQSGGFYIFNVASVSGSAQISDTVVNVKHQGAVTTHADYSTVTADAANATAAYDTYEVPASGDMIIIIDNDKNGYITQGDVIKIDTDLANTGDVLEVKVGGNVAATQNI